MGKVTIPDINVGDEIVSADINTFISSINTISSSATLNGDNLREQAIDRRNLAHNVATYTERDSTSDKYHYNSDSDHLITTGNDDGVTITLFDTLTSGGNTLGVGANSDGLITLAPKEYMVITCSFEYHVNYDAAKARTRESGEGGYQVEFKLQYRHSSSSNYFDIQGTLRKSNIILACYKPSSDVGAYYTPKASMTIVTVIENTTVGDVDYEVALAARAFRSRNASSNITANVKRVQMFAKVVRK